MFLHRFFSKSSRHVDTRESFISKRIVCFLVSKVVCSSCAVVSPLAAVPCTASLPLRLPHSELCALLNGGVSEHKIRRTNAEKRRNQLQEQLIKQSSGFMVFHTFDFLYAHDSPAFDHVSKSSVVEEEMPTDHNLPKNSQLRV